MDGWIDERMNGIDQFQRQQRNAACAIIYTVVDRLMPAFVCCIWEYIEAWENRKATATPCAAVERFCVDSAFPAAPSAIGPISSTLV